MNELYITILIAAWGASNFAVARFYYIWGYNKAVDEANKNVEEAEIIINKTIANKNEQINELADIIARMAVKETEASIIMEEVSREAIEDVISGKPAVKKSAKKAAKKVAKKTTK